MKFLLNKIKEMNVSEDESSKKKYVPRGRKKNNLCKLENIDITKYVQATVTTINGEKYFMDQHNILFKFNTNEIVGHIVNSEVQWF